MSVNNNNNHIHRNSSSHNNPNNPKATLSMSNATRYIITVLVQYQKLNDTQLQQKEKQKLLTELLNINAVELVDNFNLSVDESISKDFETIYQMILKQMNPKPTTPHMINSSVSPCNVTLCQMIQRNNRDRITKYGISNIYYGIKDDAKIVIFQLLDKIHCYYMHSFDFGLKFTKNESQMIYDKSKSNNDSNNGDIDPMLSGIKQLIESKKKKKNIPKTLARFDDNRYVTKIHTNIEEKETEQRDSDIQYSIPDIVSHTSFNFGKRWRYSKKYKNNSGIDKMNGGTYSEWFVSQKYTNLKREMLSNSLKKIPMQQWHQINAKATNYLHCARVKSLKSNVNVSITLEHIICVLIYCNFTSIKNSLTDTYDTINKFEEWKEVKVKHCEYANFGRILTETVECFGGNETDTFYHTLLGTFSLHSIQARFFVPTSMTRELSVMTYYCYNSVNLDRYNNVLILGLSNAHCISFNCAFLSDFSIENEYIFLGGKHTLHFSLIYNIRKLENYQFYIAAIAMIDDIFVKNNNLSTNTIDMNVCNAFKRCVLSQIDEEHCIPSDIDYYLSTICISRKYINIDMKDVNSKLLIESSLLFQYPQHISTENIISISIDSLCRLFPNVRHISISHAILDRKCLLLSQIHEFLCGKQLFYGNDLSAIDLINPIFISDTNLDIITQYSQAFLNSGWTVESKDNGNGSVVLKIVKQKNGASQNNNHTHTNPHTFRVKHERGGSAPSITVDTNPFSVKAQMLNHSTGALVSPEEQTHMSDIIDDNQSDLTDLSNYTQFHKVNIKMRIKQKDSKDLEVNFDFNNGDSAVQLATEMINELKLPMHYKQEIVSVINATLPQQTHNAKQRNRSQTHEPNRSYSNVSLVEFSYPQTPQSNLEYMHLNNDISDGTMVSNTTPNTTGVHSPQSQSQTPQTNLKMDGSDAELRIIHEMGPTKEQKLALQQQQTHMIKKHVRISISDISANSAQLNQARSIPNITIQNSRPKPRQTSAPNVHVHVHEPKKRDYFDERKRKQTLNIFDAPLVLSDFDKYSFPLSSVDLLEGKKAEFFAEFTAFLSTQSQIYDLKLEHIKIQNEDNETGNACLENQQNLVRSMQEKIEWKRKELNGKWDEFVEDQKEINDLKQQISQKHLVQFKQQLHFEKTSEFVEIMKSNQINQNEKDKLKLLLKDFRSKMMDEYKVFREQLYGEYEGKLKQITNE